MMIAHILIFMPLIQKVLRMVNKSGQRDYWLLKGGVTEEGEAVWCFEANKAQLQVSTYNKMQLIDFRSKSSSFQ